MSFQGLADDLQAKYHAWTTQLFGEIGQKVDLGRTALEPFVGLAYVNLDVKAYHESGGPGALQSDGGSVESTFSTLGLHGWTNLGDRARLRGTLGWRRHIFGDNVPTSTNAFDTGSSFTVAGVPLARNVAVVEVGVEAELGRDMTLVASYGSQFGSGQKDQQFASLLLKWR